MVSVFNNFKGLAMQRPTSPPETGNDTSSRFWQELEAKLAPLEDTYLHWHDLQQKQMPVQGINHKQWWQLLKAKRRARIQRLPFTVNNDTFYWVLDDDLLKQLTEVERALSIYLPQKFLRRLSADNFIVETVASVQLSNDAVNEQQAHGVLRTGRPIGGDMEKLLESHYYALSEQLPEKLTPESVLSLQQQLMADDSVSWRTQNDLLKHEDQALYVAPPVSEIQPALQQLCDFANQHNHQQYMPPLLKAIILHYLLAVIRPFHQGNGRLARALFYWQCLKAGYQFMEVVSLSKALLADKELYYQAFLLAQTDSNDITYFLMQQLGAIATAIGDTCHELEQLSTITQQHPVELNPRQQHILAEMRQRPSHQYRLARYKKRMQITYETSRTDLMKLAKKGYAKKVKVGKAFVYSVGEL